MSSYKIIGGPSKFDLFQAFPDRIGGHRRSITFKVRSNEVNKTSPWSDMDVVLDTISWENGSGESWVFDGFVTRFGWLSKEKAAGQRVTGVYETDRRTGHMQITGPHDPLK